MPDKSVNCCVTSPPYFGLRDYGHEGQIGLEETPEQYVAKLVEVFMEVKRVLKDDGTLWLNLGDSYAGSGKGFGDNKSTNKGSKNRKNEQEREWRIRTKSIRATSTISDNSIIDASFNMGSFKPKDLIGIPWMVSFALRADGWYLRQDIIWHKPNPMPESVTDRCTKSHEYIFLLSKSAKYYYDSESIKYEMLDTSITRNQSGWNGDEDRSYVNGKQNNMSKFLGSEKAKAQTMANKRSVWTVTTKPYSEAHFATYPEDLIVDCIKAGCPPDGIVLDPFMGAGTTALVARKLSRNYVGFELNEEYIRIAKNRLQSELGMFV